MTGKLSHGTVTEVEVGRRCDCRRFSHSAYDATEPFTILEHYGGTYTLYRAQRIALKTYGRGVNDCVLVHHFDNNDVAAIQVACLHDCVPNRVMTLCVE
jgi:hypothetical protein